MRPSKDHLTLHDIREIHASKLFTEMEREAAIVRILAKWQSNPLFASVLAGTTTFQEQVKDYVADNMGLGIFKRWELDHKPSSEFIENISQLFDVEMWYMPFRCGPVHRSLISEVARPSIVRALFYVIGSLSLSVLLGFVVFSGLIRDWHMWPYTLFVLLLLLVFVSVTHSDLDDPFSEKRELAEKLLSDAVELDEVIKKYWKQHER